MDIDRLYARAPVEAVDAVRIILSKETRSQITICVLCVVVGMYLGAWARMQFRPGYERLIDDHVHEVLESTEHR